MCPACLERPTDHVVPLDHGYRLAACVECWPELLDQLRRDGFSVSGCVGRCCAPDDDGGSSTTG